MMIKKCPKCGCKKLFISEIWNGHCIDFGYENGTIQSTGSLTEGNPYKVEATCVKCGYGWRLKKVTNINDLKTE